jgi:hypothetical protein
MGLFSSQPQQQYAPLPAAPAAPPTPVDAGSIAAAQSTKAALAAGGGYGSTILNGGQGITTQAPVAGKTLLGF